MPLEWQLERATKLDLVRQLLRARGIELPAGAGFRGEGSRFGYRNRIRLRVENGRLRFFNPEKLPSCAVLEPPLVETVAAAFRISQQNPQLLRGFAHVELRTPDLSQRGSLFAVAKPGQLAAEPAALYAAFPELIVGVRAPGSSSAPCQRYPHLDGASIDVPLGAFMQVNSRVNLALVDHVAGEAQRRGVERFADLFCGSGNFALALAGRGMSGVGVERSSEACSALEDSARRLALSDLRCQAGDAVDLAMQWASASERFDLVIVDGPRAGLKHGHAAIAKLARRAVLICSCRPETMARDVAALAQHGFRLSGLTLFDMFPCTQHVECAAWLDRR